MSLRDYKAALALAPKAPSFEALVMAAIRRAPSQEAFRRLTEAFPVLDAELAARSDSKLGGWIEGDPEPRPLPTVEMFPGEDRA